MRRALPLSLLSLLLLAGVSRTARAEELKPEEIYRRAARSVITLKVTRADGAVQGSAFFAIKEGVAVTAWHVVRDAQQVTARLSNGEEYESSGLIDRDEKRDVAIIRVKVAGRPMLPLAEGDPEVGAKAFVVGAPRGLEFSITDGLISQIRTMDGVKLYQFSCPASPGNSGGPLLSTSGEVLGVVSFQQLDGANLNFAMPVIYARGLDVSLPTQPWANVKSAVPAPAIANPATDEFDRVLGEVWFSYWDACTWYNFTLDQRVDKPNGYRDGVPPTLYTAAAELYASAEKLRRLSPPDPVREKVREWHLVAATKLESGFRLLVEAILAATKAGGWDTNATAVLDLASNKVKMPEPYPVTDLEGLIRKSKVLAMLKLSGEDPPGESTGAEFDLGATSLHRDPLLFLLIKPKGLAAELGLEPGDRIVAVDEMPLKGLTDLKLAIRAAAGGVLDLTVRRKEKDLGLHCKVPRALPELETLK